VELLLANPRLRDAGEALIDAANAAGGRDNVTVVLLRLEEVELGGSLGEPPATEQQTVIGLPAVQHSGSAADGLAAVQSAPRAAAGSSQASAVRRRPRPAPPRAPLGPRRRRVQLRHLKTPLLTLVVIALISAGAWLALQQVYFVATNGRGLVTLYQGVPYALPGNLDLYSRQYVSGVDASQVPKTRLHKLLNHSLRSEQSAATVIHSLEQEQLE